MSVEPEFTTLTCDAADFLVLVCVRKLSGSRCVRWSESWPSESTVGASLGVFFLWVWFAFLVSFFFRVGLLSGLLGQEWALQWKKLAFDS